MLKSKESINNFIVEAIRTNGEDGFFSAIDAILTPKNDEDGTARLSLIYKLEELIQQGEVGNEIKLEKPFDWVVSIIPIYGSISINGKTMTVGVFLFRSKNNETVYEIHPTNDEEKFNVFLLDN
ncbi:MAG: hypothetical protein LBH46_02680 [Rickettsiales bacterium]|jgi:hypothetical protein|nr:hypothetical protein [Rickettsiales bacterium]